MVTGVVIPGYRVSDAYEVRVTALHSVLRNCDAMLFESREKGVDIMRIGVRDLPGNEYCFECFFCSLLSLEAEVFEEYPRCLYRCEDKGTFCPRDPFSRVIR